MTSLTRNLPWFVRDLGVAIVGEKCYVSLVENLNVGDMDCLKFALSKGLGIGIVVGGSIMKVPQILLIVNAGSARGLSFPAYILETLSYAITLAYSFRNNFPFSTYGENLFLTLQNVIITFLILIYSPSHRPLTRSTSRLNQSQRLGITALFTIVSAFSLYSIDTSTLSILQMTTLPLSLFSKFPQIRQNLRAQSTGQLSAFAVLSQIAGCLARLFTTATEVGDSLVSAGFALALALNLVLGLQLYLYWGKSSSDASEEGLALNEHAFHAEKQHSTPPQWQQPTPQTTEAYPLTSGQSTPPHRVATPPPRTPSSAGGKKWARKVD